MLERLIPIALLGLLSGALLGMRTLKPSGDPPPKEPHWARFPNLFSGLYGSLLLHFFWSLSGGGEALAWAFLTVPFMAIPISGVSFSTRLWFSTFTGRAIRGGSLGPALVLLATSSCSALMYGASGNDSEAETGRLMLAVAALVSASWLVYALSLAIRKRAAKP